MRRGYGLAGLVFLTLGAATAAAARTAPATPARLCVIDQSLLLQRSRLATDEANRFAGIRQQAQTRYDNDSRALDADVRALQSFRASLPAAVVKTRTADIDRRRAELAGRGEQINRDLAQLNTELTRRVVQSATPLFRAVAVARGCAMLLARSTLLDLIDPTLDITEDVIARINTTPTPAKGR